VEGVGRWSLETVVIGSGIFASVGIRISCGKSAPEEVPWPHDPATGARNLLSYY